MESLKIPKSIESDKILFIKFGTSFKIFFHNSREFCVGFRESFNTQRRIQAR